MSEKSNGIKYGSIIHLENTAPHGGYLGSSVSVMDEDVLGYLDQAVRTFVFTHLFENRIGSGSWEIVPNESFPSDSLFAIVSGLADKSLVSIQIKEPENTYIFADETSVYISQPGRSADLKKAATFKLHAGLAGKGVSFESVLKPNFFLRHTGFKLFLHENDGSDIFKQDASFILDNVENNFGLLQSANFEDRYLKNSVGDRSVKLEIAATETTLGEPVRFGDKIRLRNINLDGAYLDTYDWVGALGHPFDGYKPYMQNGVFTLDASLRPAPYNRVTPEWTLQSADGKKDGEEVTVGATLLLQNNWLKARVGGEIPNSNKRIESTYLTTFRRVSANDSFDESRYAGEQMFVFVGPDLPKEDASNKWKITLSDSSKNFYYLWGESGGRWLDFGALHIDGLLTKPLAALKVKSEDKAADDLVGKVSYGGEGILDFKGAREKGNVYNVEHSLNRTIKASYPNGKWTFGASKGKKIVAIDIASADNGRTFAGTITYEGEAPTSVKGMQPSTKTFKKDDSPLFYDFFNPHQWSQRIEAIGRTLVSDKKDIEEIVALIEVGQGNVAQKESQKNQIQNIGAIRALMHEFWAKLTNVAQSEIKNLAQQNILPPVHTIQGLIGKITIDFEIVQRAIQQRRPTHNLTSPNAPLPKNNLVQSVNHLIQQWQSDSGNSSADILSKANQLTKNIQGAIQQSHAGDGSQANNLLMTDKLAKMALAPLAGLLSAGDAITPITYFDKSIYVRLVPYSDQLIFIGLTYDLAAGLQDSTIPPFDLMAIPHEIGHFVYHYQHARLPGLDRCPDCGAVGQCSHTHSAHNHVHAQEHKHEHHDNHDSHHAHGHKHRSVRPNSFGWVSNDTDLLNNPYHHWCEEIFSDLYGCMVSGPYTALGIQSVLASGDKQRLMEDDVLHPTPIVRPYLVSQMLRQLGELDPRWAEFKETAMILDANWTAILDRWGMVLEDVFNGRPANIIVPSEAQAHIEPFTRVNVSEMIKHGSKIIDKFAHALLANITIATPWCVSHDTLNKYADAFGELAKNLIDDGSQTSLQSGQPYAIKKGLFPAMPEKAVQNQKNDIETGATLFKEVLEGWHDSGPKGGGLGN